MYWVACPDKNIGTGATIGQTSLPLRSLPFGEVSSLSVHVYKDGRIDASCVACSRSKVLTEDDLGGCSRVKRVYDDGGWRLRERFALVVLVDESLPECRLRVAVAGADASRLPTGMVDNPFSRGDLESGQPDEAGRESCFSRSTLLSSVCGSDELVDTSRSIRSDVELWDM